ADSVLGVAGFGRAGIDDRRRVLRPEGVDFAGFVLADLEADDFFASVPVAAFSAGFSTDDFGSAVTGVSVGGTAIVAPTEDKRLVPLFELALPLEASVFSATGMPPLNASNAPPKRT